MRVVFGLALLSCAAIPLAGSAEPQNSPADYVRRPSAATMVGATPAAALRAGKDGKATIQCTVSVEGALKRCRVLSEEPAGFGFGQAAVALSSQFLMKPEIKNGKAVEVPVNIPLYFPGAGDPTGSHIAGTDTLERQRLVTNINWQTAPSYADVQAAYPAKAKNAKVGGRASLQCKFADDNALGACTVLNEAPNGYGFGETAVKLAKSFRAAPRADGQSWKGQLTLLPVTFPVGMVDGSSPNVTSVDWLARPRPEDFASSFPAAAKAKGVGTSRVVLRCMVSPAGRLADCAVRSEEPVELGFGQAALGLSRGFAMRAWSEDGIAMAGRPINLPIVYENRTAPPGAAPAQPAAPAPAAVNNGPTTFAQ